MLLAHFDWSVNAGKRWVCLARRNGASFECWGPQPAPLLPDLFASLRSLEPHGPVLAGFDTPLGIPASYAARAGITDFLHALRHRFGDAFYAIAADPRDISLDRPFYPARPGSAKKEHLCSALQVDRLRRECEEPTATRGAACELFWTLGPNQAGRGALLAWRHLIRPALERGQIAVWPFHGELDALLAARTLVVAECYPAEACVRLGLPRRFGKTRREARRQQAPRLFTWCGGRHVNLSPELRREVEAGFAHDDAFDSFVGLLGLIEVLLCPELQAVPLRPEIRRVEGWILGAGL